MIAWSFEDADAAREAFQAAIEYLFFEDGYSMEQLRRDLIEPALHDLALDLPGGTAGAPMVEP